MIRRNTSGIFVVAGKVFPRIHDRSIDNLIPRYKDHPVTETRDGETDQAIFISPDCRCMRIVLVDRALWDAFDILHTWWRSSAWAVWVGICSVGIRVRQRRHTPGV